MAEPEPVWSGERRPWGRADALALAVWTAVLVAFFWDAVSLRRALFYFDLSELNLPYRDFLARELRAGRFSRWCPGLHCGLPLYSESQAGYLHPLKYLLYPWLSSWAALNLDTVLSIWLAGASAYGWLRRHVGAVGALTGAAVFGLSGFVWAHLVHTSWINALAGLPLAFWALESAWEGGRLRGVALGAGALACEVFAGQVQSAILTGLAVAVYGLYRATVERGLAARARALGAAGGLLLLGGLLAAVQWVPSKELLDRSPRAGGLSWDEQTYGSWHPELLPTLLVRDLYGSRARDTDWIDNYYPYHEMNVMLGVAGLSLAALGAAAGRDRWAGFWLALAGLGGLLMLGRFTSLFDHMNRLPVVGSSRIPVRYHLWVSLACAALAAVGADRLARPGRVRWRGAGAVVAAIVAASIALALYAYEPIWNGRLRPRTDMQARQLAALAGEVAWAVARASAAALATWAVIVARGRGARPRLAALLPLVVIAELLGAHWWDVPTVDPRYWTDPPPTVARIEASPPVVRVHGAAGPMANAPGYAVRPESDYFEARDALAWNLAPVWGLASSGGATPIYPRRLLRFQENATPEAVGFDLAGVTHLLNDPDLPGARVGAATLARNPGALPRARLMGRPVYARDESDAARALRALGAEARRRVLVEDPDRPLPDDAEVAGTARLVRDEPERVAVEADAATPAYLVLADTFDPGWSATRDGRPVAIRPAFVAFRAVYLPPGRHRVEFRYRPAGFAAGLAATLAGLIVAAACLARRGPVARLGPEHGPSPWPRRWPIAALLAALAVVAGSAVRFEGGGVGAHPRWSGSFHQFTWKRARAEPARRGRPATPPPTRGPGAS